MSIAYLYLSFLTRHFCKSDDSLDAKRRQCMYVSVVAMVLLWAGIHTIQAILFGTFWKSLVLYLWCGFLIAVMLHCRLSRSPRSHRIFYLALMLVTSYSAIYRGGFSSMPQILLISNCAPATALFVSPHRYEVIGWFFVFLAQMVLVYVLGAQGVLPENAIRPQDIPLANFFHIFHLAITSLIMHWFVYHIYTMEKETRQTLQADLDLFTRLSHEIRTPITVISGMVELMADWRLDRTQRRSLSDLSAATRRLGHVVHDILSFSAASTSSSSPSVSIPLKSVYGWDDSTIFNLRDVIDTVIDYHLPHAEATKIEIYTDIPPHLPAELIGAKERLTCVLDQLVGNAIKFTPSGSVKIEVFGHANSETCEYVFRIHDTGIGFTEAQLLEVHNPALNATKKPMLPLEAAGKVGLILANRLVQAWGYGPIQAESGGHRSGSTFTFSAHFRAHHKVVVDVQTKSLPQPSPSPLSILLVDDDRLSARGITQLCVSHGAAVRHVTFWSFSETMCRLADLAIFVLPTEPSIKFRESLQRSVEQIAETCPHVTIVAVANSNMQPWCTTNLPGAQCVQKPLSLAAFEAATKASFATLDPPRLTTQPFSMSGKSKGCQNGGAEMRDFSVLQTPEFRYCVADDALYPAEPPAFDESLAVPGAVMGLEAA